MDLRPFLIFAGAGAFLWAIVRWRTAVQLVMVLLVLEGAIRKWLFPGAQDLVYLAKDVLLLGAYAGCLRDRALNRIKPPPLPAFHSALALGAVVGFLQIFNPKLPNLLVGLLGFKAYLLYVPLIFVVPAALPTDRELVSFLRRYIMLSIPVGLLGVAQFLSPSGSFLNVYARPDEATGYVSTFGSSNFVRVTATFSYITGYGSYLVAMTILILAYLAATRWRLRPSLAAYVALGMAAVGMLMTGSRGPVLILALLFPLYWWLAVMRGAEGGATFARLLVGVGLLGLLLASVGSEAVGAFVGRAAGSEDIGERLTLPFISPWETLPAAGPLGYGIGATHQTAAAVTGGIAPYSWLHGQVFEAESGRVMFELGPVGFLLVYFVRVYLIFFALRQVLALTTTFHRAIATACLMFFLAELPGSIVFDITSDLFYWFFGGLLLTVMRLDRLANLRAARAGAAAMPPAAPALPRIPPLPAAASRPGRAS
ncbi:MAG TPA: hypothetical protein VHB47_20230 [Thermoanaerobaculia bacterium]|jgi:hypothetical protein|nr:hypothetical protein [Thermoanaerobaculia bacterium]